jgi:hypothetical protein
MYQFIQKWHSDINNSSRGQFYSGFKNDFFLENYLLRLSEYNRKWITKFRTSNLRLPIETGRWYNIICLTMFLSKYPTWFWKIYPSPTSLNIDSTHLIHLKVCWFSQRKTENVIFVGMGLVMNFIFCSYVKMKLF